MIKSFLTLTLSLAFHLAFTQNLYYKTIDLKTFKDSIVEYTKNRNYNCMYLAQNSYWNSTGDTTDYPDSYNSIFFIYQSHRDSIQAVFTTNYMTFKQSLSGSYALEFANLSREELYHTKIHPLPEEPEFDTTYLIKNNIPVNETNLQMFTQITPSRFSIDGATSTIYLKDEEGEIEFTFDPRWFYLGSEYFPANSKLPFYTFLLLVQKDRERHLEDLDWEEELAKHGVVDEKTRLNYFLSLIQNQKKELKENERYFKKELKKLK